MLVNGIYRAVNDDEYAWNNYDILIQVKETEKSFVFTLIENNSRFSSAQIDLLFAKSKRVVINKWKSGHAMSIWNNKSFTIYPFQAGISFYFELIEEN